MAKVSKQSAETNPGLLVKAAAREEKRLLKEEARAAELVEVAERRWANAASKLSKANAQCDKRRDELLSAEVVLRRCQTARGIGPNGKDGHGVPADTPAAPESDASPLPEPSEDADIT